MPLLSSELKLYKSAIWNDGASNGGKMSSVLLGSGVKNAWFPDVPESERAAGSTKYRKAFWKAANAANIAAVNPRFFVETRTPGADALLFFPGTQTDTEADLTGTERLYGAGVLNAAVTAGATSIQVLVEDAAFNIFRAGDEIRLSSKTSVDDSTNPEEFLIIDTGGVSYAGNVATLQLTTAVANSYSTPSAAKVASCYKPATLRATADNFAKSSTNGTYNLTYAPIGYAIGGIEETWTLTFTSATAFTITGASVGSVGSSTTSSTVQPNNAAFSSPYFQIPAGFFTGTWATGDTFTFQTHPAARALWVKRVVPPACPLLGSNSGWIALRCESES